MSKISLWNFDFIKLIEEHFGLPYNDIKKAIEKFKEEK